MKMDYHTIGGRVARRRKKLGLTQAKVAEQAEISDQYLSNIERAVSIPSVDVLMRLAAALDTTPDEFLLGAAHSNGEAWRSVAEQLRQLDLRQLRLVERFVGWVSGQEL